MVFSLFSKNKTVTEEVAPTIDVAEVLNIKPKSHLDSKIVKVISNLDSCQSSELNYLIDKPLQKIGFDTQIIDGINDKGIDIIAFSNGKKAAAIQCKAWNPKRTTEMVSKQHVLAFQGKVMSDSYSHGIFVTTHYFTTPALEEVSDNIILVDRRILHNLIATYFPEELAETLYYQTLDELKSCQKCSSGKLIKLYSKNKNKYYYVCETCKEFHSKA